MSGYDNRITMNITASRRWVAAFVLLWPGAAFAYFGSGIVLLPVFFLAILLLFILACWVLIPALTTAWAVPARGSGWVGIGLAGAMICTSVLVVLATGSVSTATPFRAVPLVWRSLALATAMAALLIVIRMARGMPNAALPRLLWALGVSWALLMFLGWLWDGWTRTHRPVQRTALDAPLSSLRPLRADEAGAWLSSATPPENTCVLRLLVPGAKPQQVLAIALYGRGTAAVLRADPAYVDGAPSLLLVGLAGKTPGVGAYMGLSRVSFTVRQWQSLGLRSPRSDDGSVQPYALNVVTDHEIPCDASAPYCRRFRAHLVADNAAVELEERCSDANAPTSFSTGGNGYRPWQ